MERSGRETSTLVTFQHLSQSETRTLRIADTSAGNRCVSQHDKRFPNLSPKGWAVLRGVLALWDAKEGKGQ